MKILNLYAGVGGNRKLLTDADVTAVESNSQLAEVYADLYPNEHVIVSDAHEYLAKHFKEFDFIWTSTPCQSHSSMRQNLAVRFRGTEVIYPDMSLYQEILLLKYNAICPFVVENVKPYYAPLIKPDKYIQRHCFWTNFEVDDVECTRDALRRIQIPDLQEHFGINLDKYKLQGKRQILRNCVYPYLGEHLLNQAKIHYFREAV
jgi:DNA (cytosine-5)-methyltransferase 1